MKKPTVSQMSSTQRRIKSDLNGSAQSAGLCELNETAESVLSQLRAKVIEDKRAGHEVRLCIWIMLHTGARVSEVLRLRWSDVALNGMISLPSSKGSNSRMCVVPLDLFVHILQCGAPIPIFCFTDRFTVYRQLKAWGCYFGKVGSINKSVTHVCRNLYAYQIRRLTSDGEQLSRALGHKSSKSRQYYERKIE